MMEARQSKKPKNEGKERFFETWEERSKRTEEGNATLRGGRQRN